MIAGLVSWQFVYALVDLRQSRRGRFYFHGLSLRRRVPIEDLGSWMFVRKPKDRILSGNPQYIAVLVIDSA